MLILVLDDQYVAKGHNRSMRFVDEAHKSNHSALLFDGKDSKGRRIRSANVFCDILIPHIFACFGNQLEPIELRLILDLDWWHMEKESHEYYGYEILEELAARSNLRITRVAVVTVMAAHDDEIVKAKVLKLAPNGIRVAVFDHGTVQAEPVIQFLTKP